MSAVVNPACAAAEAVVRLGFGAGETAWRVGRCEVVIPRKANPEIAGKLVRPTRTEGNSPSHRTASTRLPSLVPYPVGSCPVCGRPVVLSSWSLLGEKTCVGRKCQRR